MCDEPNKVYPELKGDGVQYKKNELVTDISLIVKVIFIFPFSEMITIFS